ncbi:MAG: orotate phosphoribosyltransferase [Thermoprotei archaeon]|nr:MAG: orotate phosphoribosyltransferase [Thermoprotei archaeon]
MSTLEELVEAIVKLGMFKVGSFKLTSGIESPYYIDLRRLYSYPRIARLTAEMLLDTIDVDYDMFVGVATAGIPLATYMACVADKPLGYVRLSRKEHGTQSVVEGVVEGKRVVVIDDVATTGGTLLTAVEVLKQHGAEPVAVAVIIDREQGASKRIEEHRLRFYKLLTVRELIEIARKKQLIDEETATRILSYVEKWSRE